MTALSFVWVYPYSQNSRCDTSIIPEMEKSKVFKLRSLGKAASLKIATVVS